MAYLLILGAKSDMAKATAHRFAREGFDIYLAARDHDRLEQEAVDLKVRYRIEVRTLEFDVTNFHSHKEFYSALDPKPIGIACFAGTMGEHEKAKDDFEEMRKIIDTNFTGCASVLNIAARDFETRGEGFIIGVSSVAGDRGRQSNYYYGSAKAGFTAYLSGLRNRLFASGVHVMTVKPGFVATRMTEGMNLPERLTAQPEDVANDIFDAYRKRKNVIYTKWFWRFIMFAIVHTPEAIFKRLKL